LDGDGSWQRMQRARVAVIVIKPLEVGGTRMNGRHTVTAPVGPGCSGARGCDKRRARCGMGSARRALRVEHYRHVETRSPITITITTITITTITTITSCTSGTIGTSATTTTKVHVVRHTRTGPKELVQRNVSFADDRPRTHVFTLTLTLTLTLTPTLIAEWVGNHHELHSQHTVGQELHKPRRDVHRYIHLCQETSTSTHQAFHGQNKPR